VLFNLKELKQKEDQLALEIDTLKLRLSHLERLANSQGLSGVLFRRGNGSVADQNKAS
jgi:hypothetical protein